LAELAFAVSLILGLAVRLVSVLAIVFVLHLWLGIYRPGDPAEWPWSYIFLAMVMFFFAIHAAGRSLGLASCSTLRASENGIRRGRRGRLTSRYLALQHGSAPAKAVQLVAHGHINE
jgi:uncharacterized membrane protein YphA (DoxX/SURF4 family)